MDEELDETDVPTVGERLRAAREEKGLSLEDIAAQTRIPRRHLESIETADWDKLPAPTYTDRLRQELCVARSGSTAPRSATSCARKWAASASPPRRPRCIEAADPARTMPKWLVLCGRRRRGRPRHRVMSWLNNRSLEQTDGSASQPTSAAPGHAAARRRSSRAAGGSAGRAGPGRPRPRSLRRGSRSPTRARPCSRAMLQPGQTYSRPADRDRAVAQGRQARGAEGHGRLGRRSAGRTAGQGRLEGQPQGPRDLMHGGSAGRGSRRLRSAAAARQ